MAIPTCDAGRSNSSSPRTAAGQASGQQNICPYTLNVVWTWIQKSIVDRPRASELSR